MTTGTFSVAPTVDNKIICIVTTDRYDGSPTVSSAPTASRSGAETFTHLGWIGHPDGRQFHILAATITSTATTGVTAVETVGANCDLLDVRAFEVSGMAAIGSLFLAAQQTRHSFPGTGSFGSGLLGTLSGQPAMLLAYGHPSGGTLGVDTGYTDIVTEASGTLSHKRLTATTSVEATCNVSVDGNVFIAGFALLESGAGGGGISTAWIKA